MLIDIDKMYEILRGSNVEHLSKRIVESCATKAPCDECANRDYDGECLEQFCTHMCKTSYFKPKECTHDWVYGHYLTQAYRKCVKCSLTQEARFDE